MALLPCSCLQDIDLDVVWGVFNETHLDVNNNNNNNNSESPLFSCKLCRKENNNNTSTNSNKSENNNNNNNNEILFCVTCGECFCLKHSKTHRYEKGKVILSTVTFHGADHTISNIAQKYPCHSFFISVPTFFSNSKNNNHEKGVQFPSIQIKELEENNNNNTPLVFPFYNISELTQLWDSMAEKCDGKEIKKEENNKNENENKKELSLPIFRAEPSTSWCYTALCQICQTDQQLYKVNGDIYKTNNNNNNNNSTKTGGKAERVRQLQRLGHLMTLLVYCKTKKVVFIPSDKFFKFQEEFESVNHTATMYKKTQSGRGFNSSVSSMTKSPAIPILSSEEVVRADGVTEFHKTQRSSPNASVLSHHNSNIHFNNSTNTNNTVVPYSRQEVSTLCAKAAVCGFDNPSFLCYMNSSLQCLLRCTHFCKPIYNLKEKQQNDNNNNHHTIDYTPGPVTHALWKLLHQLYAFTPDEIHENKIYGPVKQLFSQVCKVCPIFAEDEQQDAQEFLISLLNACQDEFDNLHKKLKKEADEKNNNKKTDENNNNNNNGENTDEFLPRLSFEGTLKTEVFCLRCHAKKVRREKFMSISVPVEGTIEEGLKSVFHVNRLEGKDRYACEFCFKKLNPVEQENHNEKVRRLAEERKNNKKENKKEKKEDEEEPLLSANVIYSEAEVSTSVTQLGESLAVHLLRFQYDEKLGEFIKLTKPVKIPLKIDLADHVSTEVLLSYAHLKTKRKMMQRFPDVAVHLIEQYLVKSSWDDAVASKAMMEDGYTSSLKTGTSFHSRTGSTLPNNNTNNNEGSNFSTSLTTPPPLSSSPGSTNNLFRKVTRVDVNTVDFDPLAQRTQRPPSLTRRLTGMICHRGSLHGGHYVAYVRHLTRPEIWFRCDDEIVDIVEEKVVLDNGDSVYVMFFE